MNKDWPLKSLVDTTVGSFDSSLGPLVAEGLCCHAKMHLKSTRVLISFKLCWFSFDTSEFLHIVETKLDTFPYPAACALNFFNMPLV